MIHFTSDTHFGHSNIIKYCQRPFADADEMNEAMIERWNSKVDPKDTVYHIGDFGFMSEEKLARIIARLNGQIHLVYGNHDKVVRKSSRLRSMFQSVSDYQEVHLPDGKETVVAILCHYPMITWNKAHHGSIMLHGHCHHTLVYPHRARILDVGVDGKGYNFEPISSDFVLNRLKDVSSETVDHHM